MTLMLCCNSVVPRKEEGLAWQLKVSFVPRKRIESKTSDFVIVLKVCGLTFLRC